MKGRWMLEILLAVVIAATLPARASAQPAPAAPPTTLPAPPPVHPAPAPLPPAVPPTTVPPSATADPDADSPLGEEEAMVLNFERADIREVIHSLATALGISYTIDPRIEGQVTIRTAGKIAREDLWPLLNQILRNNGIAAVKVGDVYQILPVAEAKTRAIIPRSKATRAGFTEKDAFAIEVVPVVHLSADEMANILQPFVTPGGDVLSYPRANLVVITDLQSNIDRLRELMTTFDSDVFRDLRTRVFKVHEGDPDELADEILGLLAPYGVTPSAEGGGGGVYLVPLSRLNSIVAIAFDKAVFDEIERWLKLLDIPPEEGAGRQTFVYAVENAKAEDLAAVLNELFGGGSGGGAGGVGGRAPGAAPAGVGLFGAGGVSGGRGGGGGGVGGSRAGGGLGGTAGGGLAQAGGAMTPQQAGNVGAAGSTTLGGGGGRGGQLGGRGGGVGGGAGGAAGAAGAGGAAAVRGVSLPGRQGAGAAGAPGGPQGPQPIFKEEVRIVADAVTNSLVVLATKRDYQLILDILKRIDVLPRQVLLEVTIAEVTLNRDLQFGVEWALAQGRLSDTIAQDTSGNTIFRLGPKGLPVGGLINGTQRVPAFPPGGAFAVLSDRDHFNVFINAIQSRTNVKMLSAPHIMAADNREAHILVGNSIPILTSTATSTGITGTVGAAINSVQYRDTGNILTILPQVNSKGLVNMQIRQEVSAVGQASFGSTNSPSFTTREAETTVVVQDGETVLIGGIITDTVSHNRSGIPYLMDVPVLGWAFRVNSDTTDRTELIVLISPYVVRDRTEAREVTDEFADRLQGLKRMGQAVRARHQRYKDRRDKARQDAGRDDVPVAPGP